MLGLTPLGGSGIRRTWPGGTVPVLDDASFITGEVLAVGGGLGM